MKKFETKVQLLKYKVLHEVAKRAVNGDLLSHVLDIPKAIVPGREATMRCCVYKERAILSERVKLAMGGDLENPNVVEVIEIACDECPVGGYEITEACRGCIAHNCAEVCRSNAIAYDRNQKAYIDKSKCIECGLCGKVCPYSAIINYKRPCEQACKINAISMSETKAASIDNNTCIACGACVHQCPFGAIMDKSFILEAVNLLLNRKNGDTAKLVAVVAPSISSQFTYVKLGQVISAIKALGFDEVVEAAQGADKVAYEEAKELAEKKFLASSCCPAFVDFIKKKYPALAGHISQHLSPMAVTAQQIKQIDKDAKVVFIGPCIAKKMEYKQEAVQPYVDCVITFEELQALFDSFDINIIELSAEDLTGASYFGRIFARSGGLTEAIAQGLKEQGLEDFAYKPVVCNGMDECAKTLLFVSKNMLKENFIEGMACVDGCIGGAGCVNRSRKNRADVDIYATSSVKKSMA